MLRVVHTIPLLMSWYLYASTECYECNADGLALVRDMYIVDNIEEVKNHLQTKSTDDDRPFKTLPPGLSIKPSSIPGAGLGVWTERDFPKGTRFGPYGGAVTDNIEKGEYAWQIYDEDFQFKFYVDAFYKNNSNWVRYINCARTITEENLYPHQYNDEVYYVAYECIKAGTELLIWYGNDYGSDLGFTRTPGDYQKRFNEDDSKYIVENKINTNVNRLFKKCYKFFDRPPFKRPPGRFQNFDKYCLNDGSYLVCRYRHCKMNPCTNSFDCGTCKGYCRHLGRYIKEGEQFEHVDNTNTCTCREDGHFGCTINRQTLYKLCR